MAYLNFGQQAVGGKQTVEAMHDLKDVLARIKGLTQWVGQIGVANLTTNTDFAVIDADRQGFNDTLAQIDVAGDTLLTAVGENIARLYRGA